MSLPLLLLLISLADCCRCLPCLHQAERDALSAARRSLEASAAQHRAELRASDERSISLEAEAGQAQARCTALGEQVALLERAVQDEAERASRGQLRLRQALAAERNLCASQADAGSELYDLLMQLQVRETAADEHMGGVERERER